MSQEPPAESFAPPLSMSADLSETKPPQQHHRLPRAHWPPQLQHIRDPVAPPLPLLPDPSEPPPPLHFIGTYFSEVQPFMITPSLKRYGVRGIVISRDMKLQYYADFARIGYDKNRTLWIGDLRPWMDEDYFKNICDNLSEGVSVTVIKNKQTQLPEYGFIEFSSTKAADLVLWGFNGLPMPNSRQNFQFKWATLVCGLEKPDNCYIYDAAAKRRVSYMPDFYRAILNIEFVRVDRFLLVEHPAEVKVNGTVLVESRCRPLKVYDGDKNTKLTALPGGSLTLTGPLDTVDAEHGFIISATLQVNGKEIADDEFVWEPLYRVGQDYYYLNRRLEHTLHGFYGSVTVGYSVVTNALNAVVEVLLMKEKDCESSLKMFGNIEALQNIGESEVTCLPLFEKSNTELVMVRSNCAIPLTRSMVVMPSYGFSIKVKLGVMEYDGLHSIVLEGEELFKAVSETKTKSISGHQYKVEVSVTCY